MKLAELHPGFQWAEHARRKRLCESFPNAVRDAVLADVRSLDDTDYRAANTRVAQLVRDLKAAHLGRAFDEQRIRDFAENYADRCSHMPMLGQREKFALGVGVEPPPAKSLADRYEGRAARLGDPLWWRRQLRKVWTRGAENGQRELGMIRRGRAPYASDDAVRHRAAQKRRMRDYLEGHQAVNELGEQLPLLELAERSISNPALRRGEFMVRCRGFEEIARDLGHVAEFVTLTAPSAFHAQLATGGRNPAFERAIVRDAQAWLCRQWARARAKLKRLSVLFYGFRIAEPHHDATPHWHLLLFVQSRNVGTLRTVLRGCWLSEYAQERGAAEHRARFEAIEPSRGSATGYIAKYVSKNIDGAGTIGAATSDETGGEVNDGIKRVDTWASVHGIRQFQQVGGPPVGLWREARRLRDRTQDPDIERARSCADRGDWRGFVRAVGGIHSGRRTNLRLERCERGERNRYGEARPPAIIGLRYASAFALTRPHSWRIERRGGACQRPKLEAGARVQRAGSATGERGSALSSNLLPLGPVAITVRRPPHDLSALPLDDRRAADRAWSKMIYGATSAWSNPQETSQAGPQ